MVYDRLTQDIGADLINIKLKIAILEKYESQKAFCLATGFCPDRLSKIIRQRSQATDAEILHFSRHLDLEPVSGLCPGDDDAENGGASCL